MLEGDFTDRYVVHWQISAHIGVKCGQIQGASTAIDGSEIFYIFPYNPQVDFYIPL